MKTVSDILKSFRNFSSGGKMPALFIGHGNPMNALADNSFSRNWRNLGSKLPEPEAILSISAHWLTTGETRITLTDFPKTIHDFEGFPMELHYMAYPAPGAPEFARRTMESITSAQILSDGKRGFDHGTWAVLAQMYPEARIPVYQMSINFAMPPQFHYTLARELKWLREKGVLVMGSGNLVHNLRALRPQNPPYDWAIEFDTTVTGLIDKRDFKKVVDFQQMGEIAKMAHPSIDHFLPLIYTLGVIDKNEAICHFNNAFDLSSVSMRSIISIPKAS